MTVKISVIIPTFNEAAYLPGLLEALHHQTCPPDEIIVADAGSRDSTVEVALAAGCQVVQGGLPARGRNAGASVVNGDFFLFLDADVLPHSDFLASILDQFVQSSCAVATCLSQPLGGNFASSASIEVSNMFLQAVQSIQPHAPGWCIIVRREIHFAIGGFNEKLKLAEDHDYVQRAAKHGRFKVLNKVWIPVYSRRFDTDGFFRLVLKTLWSEMYVIAGKPIYSAPFGFVHGQHKPPAAAAVINRRQMGRRMLPIPLVSFENSFKRLVTVGLNPTGNWPQFIGRGAAPKKITQIRGWISSLFIRALPGRKK